MFARVARTVGDRPCFLGAAHGIFGRYIEVRPHSRLTWANDEGGADGAITTVTFEETKGATRVVVHGLYPSKEALDEAMASGSTSGCGEQLEQLDDLVVTQDAKV